MSGNDEGYFRWSTILDNQEWIKKTLDHAVRRFDEACDRWRDLYRSALKLDQSYYSGMT